MTITNTGVTIYWDHGSPRNHVELEERAAEAAMSELRGVDIHAAQADHQRQIESEDFDGYDESLTGLARTWANAARAANAAVGEGYFVSIAAH